MAPADRPASQAAHQSASAASAYPRVHHLSPASYLLPESEIGKSVASLVSGIVASMGTVFTLLVAGIYVPAAILLRARIRKLAIREQPDDPDGWLETHKLTLKFSQSVRGVIALLGPLLAGPLGELIGKATSAFSG